MGIIKSKLVRDRSPTASSVPAYSRDAATAGPAWWTSWTRYPLESVREPSSGGRVEDQRLEEWELTDEQRQSTLTPRARSPWLSWFRRTPSNPSRGGDAAIRRRSSTSSPPQVRRHSSRADGQRAAHKVRPFYLVDDIDIADTTFSVDPSLGQLEGLCERGSAPL